MSEMKLTTRREYEQPKWRKCPRCGSNSPERHPAVQSGGEVELCTHDFHLTRSNMNKPEYIAAVLAKRDRITPAGRSALSPTPVLDGGERL